jgi:hypothetical protein
MMMPNTMIAAHPSMTIATSSGAIGGDCRYVGVLTNPGAAASAKAVGARKLPNEPK